MNYALYTLKQEQLNIEHALKNRRLWLEENPDSQTWKKDIEALSKKADELIEAILELRFPPEEAELTNGEQEHGTVVLSTDKAPANDDYFENLTMKKEANNG